MTQSSPHRKIAATWGQSRRVALLSQFFHHFLQLGWEWPVLPDVFKLQTPVNHWTIELDKWINLASLCILSLSHEITNHSDTAQKVPSKLPFSEATLFSTWRWCATPCDLAQRHCMASMTRILAFHRRFVSHVGEIWAQPAGWWCRRPEGVSLAFPGPMKWPSSRGEISLHFFPFKTRSVGDKIDKWLGMAKIG